MVTIGLRQTITNGDFLKHPFTNATKSKPKVIIPKHDMKIMESLAWEATEKGLETGGYFIGTQIGKDTYVIGKSTDSGSDPLESSVRFQADINDMQREIDLMRKKYDVFWIGTWHVHPQKFCALSEVDTSSMERFLSDPECMDYDFAMVFSAYGKKMKHGIWMMKKDDLELVEVDIISKDNVLKDLPRIGEVTINGVTRDTLMLDKMNTYIKTLKKNGFNISEKNIHHPYHVIESTIDDSTATFFIPFDEKESPILFINGKMHFVPINWNGVCEFEDFVQAINIENIQWKGNTSQFVNILDRYKSMFLTKRKSNPVNKTRGD